ncbi:hypothetical protein G6N82_03650 [Altererythrobacter sp. BO-6]|nr:hypothetical protein G6N82_03650 [Altererythrobacter sp. BO-6]
MQLTCEGDPYPVLMCSCELCQRRTGAPVHIGAWFPIENVKIEGVTTAFTRTTGDMGMEATFHFCPVCGTSLWWGGRSTGFLAGKIGIAGGCFADKDFPPPTHAFYDKRRHSWINPPEETQCFQEVPPPEVMAEFMK